MKDCYDKKYLRKLLLNYKIRTEIKTRMGRVILLAIPFSDTMIDNIYLLSDDENIIWRVETNKTVPINYLTKICLFQKIKVRFMLLTFTVDEV